MKKVAFGAAILASISAALLILRSRQKTSANRTLAQLSEEDVYRLETIFQRPESFIG